MRSLSVYQPRPCKPDSCSSSQHTSRNSVDRLSTCTVASCETCSFDEDHELSTITHDECGEHNPKATFTTVYTYDDAIFYVGMISTILEITDDESIRLTAYSLSLDEKANPRAIQSIDSAVRVDESKDCQEATALLKKRAWRTSVTRKKSCEDLRAEYLKASIRSTSPDQPEVQEAITSVTLLSPLARPKKIPDPFFFLPPLQLFPNYRSFLHHEDTHQRKTCHHRALDLTGHALATPRQLKSASMLNLPAYSPYNTTSTAPTPRRKSTGGH